MGKNQSKERERGRRGAESVGDKNILFFFSLCFFLGSTKIGSQVFVGIEGKVDLRDESYAWTPKSWSFDKLREVGVLAYLFYPLFKCFVNACVGLRP